MAKPLAQAPEGGETFPTANPNYVGGVVPALPVGEDTTARLRRLRLAGLEPMARVLTGYSETGVPIMGESLRW
jgi:hypothetical protein